MNSREINTGFFDGHPFEAANGAVLYFDSGRGQTAEDLYVATGMPDSYSIPTLVIGLNSADPIKDAGFAMTTEGLDAVFFRGMLGNYSLWKAHRESASDLIFQKATVEEICELNDGNSNLHPSLSGDGLTIFFESARLESPGDLTDDENIWVAHRTDPSSPFGSPHLLEGVNTPDHYEGQPNVSFDGRELYFVRGALPPDLKGGSRNIYVAALIPAADVNGDGVEDSRDIVCLGVAHKQHN